MYLFSRVSRVSAVVPVWLAPFVVAGAVAVMGCTTPRGGSADRAETRDADGDEATADQSARATDTAAPGAVAAEDHSAALPPPGVQATATVWSFDSAAADQPPPGFVFGRTGSGRPGRWIVRASASAPSGRQVLAQVDTDPTDYRFPVAAASQPIVRDLRLSVKCKPVAGKVDQACGLVWRYQDENNYYLARANALENNVRLYYVKGGKRSQIASWSGRVTSGVWHELAITAQGDRFEVWWEGRKLLEKRDTTFAQAGKVGVWTKADSVTEFDDLSIEPVGG
jgi:hypothetical protein